MVNLSDKRNGRLISVLYPKNGRKNVLRRVQGRKIKSYTGPSGKGITVREDNGRYTSLTLSKIVQALS